MTRPVTLAGGALLAAAFLFAQYEPLRRMVALWDTSPMYSYGYLVPFIAAYLVWSRREALAALPVRPAPWLGGLLLAGWAAMLIGGKLGALLIVQQLALLPGVVGLVLLLWGPAHVRAAWAGLAYLVLMIPIWDAFTEPLHVPFQNVSAAIGVEMVRTAGVPAFRHGTFIDLPRLNIEVARACSGVNYLVAVLALGLPLSYLHLRSPLRRVLLLVAALLVAAFSNSLRVAIICVLAYLDIGSPLHGPGHMLHGLFVAGIGHVVLLVGLFYLSRGERARPAAAATPGPASAPAGMRVPSTRWLFGLAAACFAVGAYLTFHELPVIALRQPGRLVLPATLRTWTVDPFASAATGQDLWPGADATLSQRYRHPSGLTADVVVAYFGRQEQNRELVTPQAMDLHRAARPLALRAGGPGDVNLAEQPSGAQQRLVAFWYELDGDIAARPLQTKLRTAWHALVRRRSNGAGVMIATEVPAAATPPPTAALEELAGAVHEALGQSLPGRKETGG